MKKPNLFIVGAPKCGTTSLYEYLKQHPDVYMPYIKEPHFFCDDLNPVFKIRDVKKYLELFSDVSDQKIIGEASASYLFSKTAASNIKKFAPDAKIIILLRNPVEMLPSLHSERIYSGSEPLTNFEEALAAEPERKAGKKPAIGAFYAYRDVGLYSEQVKRYLDTFSNDQVLVVLFDDFKNQTKEVLKEVYGFLQISEETKIETKVSNPNKVARWPLLRKFITSPPEPLVQGLKMIIPKKPRRLLLQSLHKLTTKKRPRSPIAVKTEQELARFFREDTIRLKEILGREIPWREKNESLSI